MFDFVRYIIGQYALNHSNSKGRKESRQHYEHLSTQNRIRYVKIDVEDKCHRQDGQGHGGLGN